MSTQLTPTSELEAVNQMLGTIMEAPINSLIGVGSLDAQRAIAILAEVSREVQSPGWDFNTEEGITLPVTAFTGEVKVPANCLSVDTTGPDEGRDLVLRGLRLYDRLNHTFAIGASVKVDMVVLLPFAQLPEAARQYITVRSCRRFQRRSVGSTTLDAFNEDDERAALRAFKRAVKFTAAPNFFDSPDAQRMLRR